MRDLEVFMQAKLERWEDERIERRNEAYERWLKETKEDEEE